jgi:hypothetical protein
MESDYEDNDFEEDPPEAKVDYENVKDVLKQMRLALMVKKIPHKHMVSYILQGADLVTTENGLQVVTADVLAQ